MLATIYATLVQYILMLCNNEICLHYGALNVPSYIYLSHLLTHFVYTSLSIHNSIQFSSFSFNINQSFPLVL